MRLVRSLIGLAGFLLLWEAASRFVLDAELVPPPSEVLVRCLTLANEARFVADVASTALSWFIALCLAVLIAVPIGLVVGRIPLVRAATMPLIEFLRPLPGVALIPLITVLLGVGAQTKITLATFAAVWPILFNTSYAVAEVDRHMVETARAFRTSRRRMLSAVIVPSAAPFILTGIRLSASIALIAVVATEFIFGGSIGVGQFVYVHGLSAGRMDTVLAVTVLAGLFGLLINASLAGVQRRWLGWPASGASGDASSSRRRWQLVVSCAAVAAVLVAWQAIASAVADPYFPPPLQIADRAGELWFAPSMLSGDILPSLGMLLGGWLIAAVLGIVVGVALGRADKAMDYVGALMAFARSVPPPLLVPVFMVMFSLGPQTEVVTIVSGAIWPVLLNAVDGARSVDATKTDTARAFRITKASWIFGVVLPAAAPKIFAGLRLSLSIALILMVLSELVGTSNGIGYQLNSSQGYADLPGMWAWIVLIGVLGFVLNRVLLVVQRRSLAWHGGQFG
ncbi:ABC transporter permease [Kibdelosporangium aridum]|uniref:ABC-type nitrate/sulfonate/bicarbonate transport system, permease component n=1 Tax=Kibdelosporangium aridum TaxID=2030 RepID=A0A1W2AJ67_KIBAR|nr:ABC transporter permease [Kibdelosporangium aridum]SMC60683.1 ABC-type nitrate/sulfonate/bicarbonate transport system, permease component [Kibdelosporangium aridum]